METSQLVENLFTVSGDAFVVIDMAKRVVVRCNSAFHDIFGLPEGATLEEVRQRIAPGQEAIREELVRQLHEEKRLHEIELVLRVENQTRYVRFNSYIGDDDLMYAVVRDVSAEKLAAQRLKHLNSELLDHTNQLAAILDCAPNAIVIADHEGKIRGINRETCRVFEYRAEELEGQPVELLVPDRIKAGHVALRDNYFKAPTRRPMGNQRDVYGRRKDGTEFPLEVALAPMESGNKTWVVVVLTDMTARKQVEDELRRSNEELEQFAYVASHDLKEPLRMVASFTELLQEKYGDQLDDQAKRYIGFASEGAKRMHTMINDLLLLSRVSSQTKPFSEVKLDSVVDGVLTILDRSQDLSTVKIDREPLPSIQGDPSQLQQVFQNLIGNALKFNKSDVPTVTLRAKRRGEDLEITVSDNGIGIDKRHHERIFTMFHRLHSRNEFPGTGIGLAIVHKIMQRHGGRIELDSTLGEGSTFTLIFPTHARRRSGRLHAIK